MNWAGAKERKKGSPVYYTPPLLNSFLVKLFGDHFSKDGLVYANDTNK